MEGEFHIPKGDRTYFADNANGRGKKESGGIGWSTFNDLPQSPPSCLFSDFVIRWLLLAFAIELHQASVWWLTFDCESKNKIHTFLSILNVQLKLTVKFILFRVLVDVYDS